MVKTPTILTLLLFTIYLTACDKDKSMCTDATNPRCENYNPCLKVLPANADFVFLDTSSFVECDTQFSRIVDTFYAGPVYFKALHKNSRYEWKIGFDPKARESKEFSLLFPDAHAGDIHVTLITEIFDTNSCLLPEERHDTVTRVVNIQDNNAVSPIRGFYRGVSSQDPTDTFDIEVPPYGSFVIRNFPKGCPALSGRLSARWGYLLFNTRDTECGEPCAVGELFDNNRQIRIDYSLLENGARVDYVYTGYKLE